MKNWKRSVNSFVSALLCAALVLTLLPVTAFAAGVSAPTIVAQYRQIFGNGTPLYISGNGATTYVCTGNYYGYGGYSHVYSGDLSKWHIYGGGNNGAAAYHTYVYMNGGTVYNVVGGGDYNSTLTGNTSVTMTGGTASGGIYGGGGGSVSGHASVTMTGGYAYSVYGGYTGTSGSSAVAISGGTVRYSAYGGGYGSPITGNTKITVSGSANINGDVCGGGGAYNSAVNAPVGGSSSATVSGGTIGGSVYGGGAGWGGYANYTNGKGNVAGSAAVTMTGGTVKGGVFGGGKLGGSSSGTESANVALGTSVTISGGTVYGGVYGGGDTGSLSTGSATVGGSATVNIKGTVRITGSDGVNGGGKGSRAAVSGTKTVSVSGGPSVSSINLSSITSNRVNITGQLTGGAIPLTNASSSNLGTVVATASSAGYAVANKFSMAGKSIAKSGANLIIGGPILLNFDKQGGTGGAVSANGVYQETLPTITSLPTKSGYSFMGYYTQTNGGGTRYYDQNGLGTTTITSMPTSIQLYAYWATSQWTVTFNKQSGTGGRDSMVTAGSDGSLNSLSASELPTRQYYKFGGYYSAASGAGTQVFDEKGNVVNNKKITANTTLFANWTQNQFEITLDPRNGSPVTKTMSKADGALAGVSAPTYTGRAFLGYFTAATGGEQYLDAHGQPVAGKTVSGATTLYAQWEYATYAITYELGGGDNGSNPVSRVYNTSATIVNPTRSGYTFIGWQMNGGTSITASLILAANNPAFAKDLTLKAIWLVSKDKEVVVDNNAEGVVANKDELDSVFKTIVADDNKGVTVGDLQDSNAIKILLNVKQSANQTDEGQIKDIAQGSSLRFYDITAEKQVTTTGNPTPVTTNLTELPDPILVKIPLTGDLADLSGYAVYRVHDSAAERLPTGPLPSGKTGEYYTVENGNIVISTKKFSTYGVVGLNQSLGGVGDMPNHAAFVGADVQGRVIEDNAGFVYKVDVAWGAMKFDFDTTREWNTDLHMYVGDGLNDWRPEGFNGVNNQVFAINHSNGDVRIDFIATNNQIAGVGMTLKAYNQPDADEGVSYILPAAPVGSTDDELVRAETYLWLNGSPQQAWITANNSNYEKVAVIVVTVAPRDII